MTKSHENNNNDNDNFKHVCIITVFLLIKFFYIFIHLLNYLFRLIQVLIVLTDFIDFVVIFLLIICCSLNSPSKLILSHQAVRQVGSGQASGDPTQGRVTRGLTRP